MRKAERKGSFYLSKKSTEFKLNTTTGPDSPGQLSRDRETERGVKVIPFLKIRALMKRPLGKVSAAHAISEAW